MQEKINSKFFKIIYGIIIAVTFASAVTFLATVTQSFIVVAPLFGDTRGGEEIALSVMGIFIVTLFATATIFALIGTMAGIEIFSKGGKNKYLPLIIMSSVFIVNLFTTLAVTGFLFTITSGGGMAGSDIFFIMQLLGGSAGLFAPQVSLMIFTAALLVVYVFKHIAHIKTFATTNKNDIGSNNINNNV